MRTTKSWASWPLLMLIVLTVQGCAALNEPPSWLQQAEQLPEPVIDTLPSPSATLLELKRMRIRWDAWRCERLQALKPSNEPCASAMP